MGSSSNFVALWFMLLFSSELAFSQTTNHPSGTYSTFSSVPTTKASTSAVASTAAQQSTLEPTQSTPTESTQLEFNTDLGPCICDLTANGCDVNCCCDEECTDEDRATFSECLDQKFLVDDKLCLQSSVIFRNNSPDYVQVADPSLFCVRRDNYVDRNYYIIPEPVTSLEDFEDLSSQYGSYSFEVPSESNVSYQYADFYKSGDPIYTIYETLSLGMLGLPKSFLSQECTDTNPAAYLYDQTSTCTRIIQDLASQCESLSSLSARSYTEGFKLVSTPKFLQENPPPEPRLVNVTTAVPPNTTPNTRTETTPSNTTDNTTVGVSTINPTPFIPDDTTLYYENPALIYLDVLQPLCRGVLGVDTDCEFTGGSIPFPSYNVSSATCENVIFKVLYEITHNATDGIMSASVQVTVGNVLESDLPMVQTFQTSFHKIDQTEKSFQRSGNPGYRIGEPLLAGTRIELEEGTKLAIALRDDRNNWLTVVKSTVDGTCTTDADSRIPITFGEDIRSGCFIRISLDSVSDLCEVLQEQILNALRGPLPDVYYVAMFGNSSVDVVGDWVPVLEEDIAGVPSSPSKGTCSNMVTGVHIEVIYANVGSLQNPQPKVLGVKYNYADGKIIKYQCLGSSCQEDSGSFSQKFEITSSVTFIDASSQPEPVIAERPSWESKLPNDFLYPFTGTFSSSAALAPAVFPLVITSLIGRVANSVT